MWRACDANKQQMLRSSSLPLASIALVCVLASAVCFSAYVLLLRQPLLPARLQAFHSPFAFHHCCAKWTSSQLPPDPRGWLLDPISASSRAGISGAATTCRSVHLGQIKPGFMRGNHRHRLSNETFIVWGANTKFRVEDPLVPKGYVEMLIEADEVAVMGGPAGRAHVLVNMDQYYITHFLGCQDALIDAKDPQTDYNVWTKDGLFLSET